MSDADQSIADAGTSEFEPFDLSALYRAYYSTLCIFVRRRFGSGPPEPEDVVQAAFAQLAKLTDPGAIENPKGFLYRTACNFVLDYRRREEVKARSAGDILTFAAGLAPADHDPSRVIESRDSLAVVSAAIETLDPKRRAVLMMHSIDELSCAEIARRLKLSPTRVIQLYAQAVEACARALRQRGEDARQ